MAWQPKAERLTTTTGPLRILLHIGLPKTGSTAIQDFFCSNRRSFLAAGLLYPESFLTGRSHCGLVQNAETESHWRTLEEEIAATAPRRVFLSCEDLILQDPDWIAAFGRKVGGFLPDSEIFLLAYLRRQDLWLESWYNHAVKAPRIQFQGDFEEFLAVRPEARLITDYPELLRPWRQAFPGARLELRTYDKEEVRRDILGDALGALQVTPPENCAIASRRFNTSLSVEVLEVVRRLNALGLATDLRRAALRALNDHRAVKNNGVRHFTPAARQALLSRAAAGNRDTGISFAPPDNTQPSQTDAARMKALGEILQPTLADHLPAETLAALFADASRPQKGDMARVVSRKAQKFRPLAGLKRHLRDRELRQQKVEAVDEAEMIRGQGPSRERGSAPTSDFTLMRQGPGVPETQRPEIRLFVVAKNEAPRFPWFLNYYRRLGVDRFFVIDNGSEDGTADTLRGETNLHLFSTSHSYVGSRQGLNWVSALLNWLRPGALVPDRRHRRDHDLPRL